jgi:Flp pilus assembly pilin Flp
MVVSLCGAYGLVRVDLRGVTSLEYSLIGGFIAVVIVSSVMLLGDNLNAIFQGLTTKF